MKISPLVWTTSLAAMFACDPGLRAQFSPAEIQEAVDATFGPWDTFNESSRGVPYPDIWSNQSAVTLDGVDAARLYVNGAQTGPTFSNPKLTATISGPAVLHFSYLGSRPTYITGFDFPVEVRLDSAQVAILPSLNYWKEASVAIPAGTHELRWFFNGYSDLPHFLDQVWTEDDPRPRIIGPDEFAWRQDEAVNVPLTTNKPCTTFTAQNLPPGITVDLLTGQLGGAATAFGSFLFRQSAGNAAGMHTREVRAKIAPAFPPAAAQQVTLEAALDGSGLAWSQNPQPQVAGGEDPPASAVQNAWSGSLTTLARDATDAAVVVLDAWNASQPSNVRCWSQRVQTVVTGPGIFSLWHRMEKPAPVPSVTASPTAALHIWVNGSRAVGPNITSVWTRHDISLPAGRHSLALGVEGLKADDHEPDDVVILLDNAAMSNQPQSFTFDQWREATGQSQANLAQDAEPDGVPLLLEYALGGSPAFADPAILPEVSIVDDHFTMTVRKAAGTSGLEYTVQANKSLAANGWTTFGTEIMNEDQYELIVRCKKSVIEEPSCSLRLRVRFDTSVGL